MRKFVDVKKRWELPPSACWFKRTSLIGRLADRRPVFQARAADVHIPLSLSLSILVLSALLARGFAGSFGFCLVSIMAFLIIELGVSVVRTSRVDLFNQI